MHNLRQVKNLPHGVLWNQPLFSDFRSFLAPPPAKHRPEFLLAVLAMTKQNSWKCERHLVGDVHGAVGMLSGNGRDCLDDCPVLR